MSTAPMNYMVNSGLVNMSIQRSQVEQFTNSTVDLELVIGAMNFIALLLHTVLTQQADDSKVDR